MREPLLDQVMRLQAAPAKRRGQLAIRPDSELGRSGEPAKGPCGSGGTPADPGNDRSDYCGSHDSERIDTDCDGDVGRRRLWVGRYEERIDAGNHVSRTQADTGQGRLHLRGIDLRLPRAQYVRAVATGVGVWVPLVPAAHVNDVSAASPCRRAA